MQPLCALVRWRAKSGQPSALLRERFCQWDATTFPVQEGDFIGPAREMPEITFLVKTQTTVENVTLPISLSRDSKSGLESKQNDPLSRRSLPTVSCMRSP